MKKRFQERVTHLKRQGYLFSSNFKEVPETDAKALIVANEERNI